MNTPVLLEVFGIDESSRAHVAFIRSFASMRRLYVIIQQSPSLEALPALVALVTFVVVVCRSLVRLEVRSLAVGRGGGRETRLIN